MTMHSRFKCIGMIGFPRYKEALDTYKTLFDWLTEEKFEVLLEKPLHHYLSYSRDHFVEIRTIGERADLVIVIGGDGNMLRAARLLCQFDINIIGVNRGNLGFLTDINPTQAMARLKEVLSGKYVEDPRTLLQVGIKDGSTEKVLGIAVNELVIHASKVAHMIDFNAYINDRNAFSQRADGLIIATPTGSTAYSLSAGGPIIVPNLDAILITPMFPHSLSVRPLVIKSDSIIRLTFPDSKNTFAVACDSQVTYAIKNNDEVVIRRAPYLFRLIHDCEYDYFQNLSSKLGWSKKMY